MRMFVPSFFPSRRAASLAGMALAVALVASPALRAQDMSNPPAAPNAAASNGQTAGQPVDQTLSNTSPKKKKKVAKADRLQQTKDTKKEEARVKKDDLLLGKDSQLPDKQLYDKAMAQIAGGHYDVGRLDLQTLLNTYPDSQYQMRAKLAVADAWYKEGGTAALTQAEQEYQDFITFFPNSPEAAEAQMRMGDIYFKQMDVPDRDYEKAVKAEEEYRTMLKQYPDAPKELTAEAKQKLREVQEVLATREAGLGAFYASHNNWVAAIARYQTVVDTYPLYSHMDDVMIGIGDAYEAQANGVRAIATCTPKTVPGTTCFPEGAKARLLADYDGKAAQMYRQVVLLHSAAPHVEDAKERLTGMGLPVPTPTKQEAEASEALEGSRAQYNLQRRLEVFFLHRPDMVTAAQIGNPPLEDAKPTFAPEIVKEMQQDYVVAFDPRAAKAAAAGGSAPTPSTTASDAAPAAAPAAPAAPLALEGVPAAGSSAPDSTHTITEEATPSSGGAAGTGLGVEVLHSGDTSPSEAAPRSGASAPASDIPAATGAQDPNYGLTSVAPKNATALPPVEKPAEAPDQVNDAAGQPHQNVTQAKNKKGKPVKEPIDKSDESSSKKKPKKGLDKLNPF
jgi:outer membrane protein assembly factor BamD